MRLTEAEWAGIWKHGDGEDPWLSFKAEDYDPAAHDDYWDDGKGCYTLEQVAGKLH